MKRFFCLSFSFLALCGALYSQKPMAIGAAQTEYSDAKQLYDAGLYGSARTAFGDFVKKWDGQATVLATESKFYQAVAAKKSQHADAVPLMKAFLKECAYSSHFDDVLYHIGDYYLAQDDESEALSWFEQASADRVDSEIRNDLLFKTGYCYFVRGKHKRALAMFDRMNGNYGKYDGAVKYYRAHVDYESGNLNEALKSFRALENDPGFSAVAPYYIAHILYLQGHYAEAVRYAEPLSKSNNRKAVDMQRIVADSHFMLEEYAKAAEKYSQLMNMTRKTNRADYYHLGLSLYHTQKYSEAAANLSKVTQERDELAQNAYYHLADCYLKCGDKKRARVAFEAASRYDFDKAIQEDAAFNKLKLAYELNFAPFNEIITQFVDFIDKYPNSDKIDEAYDYMGKAFVTTKNYRQALQTMEKIKHKNLKIYTAMQRLAFYRGLELYTDTKFNDAIEFFDYSLKYGDYDNKLKARAYFWKGESQYRLGNAEDARTLYLMTVNAFGASELDEFTTAHYNTAYTYFDKKDYTNANNWFLRYVSLSVGNKRLLSDAYNRLGDCMYVARNYKSAVSYYDKAIQTSSAVGDYSMLQKAICLGLIQNNRVKIEQLKQLIEKYPNSHYCDNAYFEMARAYLALDQLKDAIYNFKVVKERYPKGSLASRAMLQLGLLYYNNGEYDNSMAFYKRVINEYPATPEAMEALAGLRNVYMEMGNFDGYMAYTKTLGSFARVELSEQDSLLFVSAQRIYERQDFAQAKNAFQKYLDSFADGRFATRAHFYLADCLYKEEDFDAALQSFEYVAAQPHSIYTEDALLRCGELFYKAQNYNKALTTFRRLETEAEVQTNSIEAIIGQMRCLEKLGDPQQCIQGADKVIGMPQASPEILREAKYLKAKSLMTLSRSTEAIPLLRELGTNTMSVEGAEAKYLLAQVFYDSGDPATAEKEVFDYIEVGTPHQYWLAKCFILLADIYHDKGEDFQALQYLETLRDSYHADDDIDQTIQQRIDQWQLGTTSLPDM